MIDYMKDPLGRRAEIEDELEELDMRKIELEKPYYRRMENDPSYRESRESFDYFDKEIYPIIKEHERLAGELLTIKAFTLKVGDRVSISPWSDWYSYTVVSRTKCTLTCKADRQTHFKESWQDGEMECEQDPNGALITMHWSRKHGWWSYPPYKVALGVRNYQDPSF